VAKCNNGSNVIMKIIKVIIICELITAINNNEENENEQILMAKILM